jgi:hypothetical protein
MGTLPGRKAGPLEEHVLICRACQDQLQASDDYVAAMRAAAKAPVKPAKKTTAVKTTAVKKAAAAPAPAVKQASAE